MTNEQKMLAMKLFEDTELTITKIADCVGVHYATIHKHLKVRYTSEFRRSRKTKNYATSKTGDKNPMWGKFGSLHHGYIGDCDDGRGYQLILKPDWFTGREHSKHIYKHHFVMCQFLGITQIPDGFVVHHIDGDKKNNSIDNLSLMTKSAHSTLHQRYLK
jgi:hypothetical protein